MIKQIQDSLKPTKSLHAHMYSGTRQLARPATIMKVNKMSGLRVHPGHRCRSKAHWLKGLQKRESVVYQAMITNPRVCERSRSTGSYIRTNHLSTHLPGAVCCFWITVKIVFVSKVSGRLVSTSDRNLKAEIIVLWYIALRRLGLWYIAQNHV